MTAKIPSNPEADSDLKTEWDWGREVGSKDASHQKHDNHRIEMVEFSLSVTLSRA